MKSKVGQVSSGQRSYQFGSEMELHLSHILHPSLHHSSTHLLTHDVSSRLQPPVSHPSDPNSSICSSVLRVCPLCQVPYHMPWVRTSYLCPSLKELTPRKESLKNNSQQCGRLKVQMSTVQEEPGEKQPAMFWGIRKVTPDLRPHRCLNRSWPG